jgi:hypothetical protein
LQSEAVDAASIRIQEPSGPFFRPRGPAPGLAVLYLLSLKANWPALMAEVETFFADPANAPDCRVFDTVDADHGRLEQRRHRVCYNLDWLFSDRLRSGHGPQNIAVVKHMAMNLIRHPKDKHRLKNRRKLACLKSAPVNLKRFPCGRLGGRQTASAFQRGAAATCGGRVAAAAGSAGGMAGTMPARSGARHSSRSNSRQCGQSGSQ